MIHRPIVTAALLAALLTGCAPNPPPVADTHPPVPALIPETIPKPPVSAETLNWQPGHWDWTDGNYVWQPGQYVPAAGHGPLWMPGYWERTPTGWAWQPAHWTS